MHTRFVLCLCAALAAGAALGCSSDHEKAAEHLARAEVYQEEGKQREALIELRSALQLDPKSAETNFRIGQLLQAQEEVGDAAFYYGEAVRLDPARTDAAVAQARLIAFAEPDRALALLEGVLQREPDNSEAHIARSHLALVQKDTEKALASALTATELDPKSSQAAHQLGMVHQARIREALRIQKVVPDDALFKAAVAAFERAAELGSPHQMVSALRQRGRVLASWEGHREEADQAFRELVERSAASDDPKVRRRGAAAAVRYARRMDDPAFRIWALEQLIAIDDSDVGAWIELAGLSQTADGSGEAVLKRLIDARPDDADAHIAYARQVAQRDVPGAIAHLEGATSRVTDPAAVLGFLVDLHLLAEQRDAANAVVDRLEKEHPDSIRTGLARAQRLIAEEKLDEAVTLLHAVNQRNEVSEGFRLLAVAEFQRGRLTEATQAIDRAIELSTQRDPVLLQLRVRIQYATRSWADLLRTVTSLLQTQGWLTPRLRAMRIEALFELGRNEIALQGLEQELKYEPPSRDTVLLFARYRAAQQPDRARSLLEAALQREPGDLRLLTALAQVELASGHGEEALQLLDTALAGGLPDARAADLRMLRAQVLLGQGRLDDAQADALRAFQAAPANPRAASVLVAIYAEQGRLPEAAASLEEAREVGALGPAGEELLARLYAQTNQLEKAIALYEQILQRNPDRASTKNDLAFLLAENGRDLDRAMELARQAHAVLGEQPNVADTLGYVYYRKQLYGPAVEQFRFAIERSEKAAPALGAATAGYHYHLGLALRGLERNDEAIEALKTALARNPDLTEAREALAELQARQPAASAPQGSS